MSKIKLFSNSFRDEGIFLFSKSNTSNSLYPGCGISTPKQSKTIWEKHGVNMLLLFGISECHILFVEVRFDNNSWWIIEKCIKL